MANSPILFLDPNGKEFIIAITVKEINQEGKNEQKTYLFKVDEEYTGTNEAVRTALGQVKEVVNYLKKSTNEKSKVLYNLFSKSVEEGGHYFQLNYNVDEPTEFTPQQRLAPNDDSSPLTFQIDINPIETNVWQTTTNKKEYHQSPAIEFIAHELGHLFNEFIISIGTVGKRNFKAYGLTDSEFKTIFGIYQEMKQKVLNMTEAEKQARQGIPSSESFAVEIQNLFAEGLGEPIKPSYSGTIPGKSQGIRRQKAKPTEFKK